MEKLGAVLPVRVDDNLKEYILTACDYLSLACGEAEENRYFEMVESLNNLGRGMLRKYAAWLDRVVAIEESRGVFGENGIKGIMYEFRSRFGFL